MTLTVTDGTFIYAVRTTGIYCSPSCSSRRPKPENVVFFDNAKQALAAGYRPCKRCQQKITRNESHSEKIAKACRYIEQADKLPLLNEIAELVGISQFHFHRLFKSITGLTPKMYGLAHRAKSLRQQLDKNNSITDSIYEAGYNSSSRFYEKSDVTLGMTPTTYQAGGKGMTIYFAVGTTSYGDILVAQSERGVCAIFLGDDPNQLVIDLQDLFPNAELVGGDKNFESVIAHVIGYIELPGTELNLPLDIQGTAFQQRVWQALCKIPAGRTMTYTDIANQLGMPKAVRAVANACAANKLAVAIPCHRVVRSDGSLSGYRWGVERKRFLLNKEADA